MICFHHLSKLTTYLSNLETAMATGKSTNFIDFSMADNGPNSQQEDSYITDLNRSLMGFSESIQTCYPSIHLSVVFGPLFCLLPRLLTVSIIQASNNGKILGKAIRNQKQRYLRIVVLVQQIVSSLINVTAALDYETKRKLSDCATNEFERLRKIVSMIDIPCSELKV